jgi:predicted dehydrogenase
MERTRARKRRILASSAAANGEGRHGGQADHRRERPGLADPSCGRAGGSPQPDPAYGYRGPKLRTATVEGGRETAAEPTIESGDQFAHEIDHMSLCVQGDIQPHTPGEEGLQDMLIVEAIYGSAKSGRTVKLAPPAGPTRRPAPVQEG